MMKMRRDLISLALLASALVLSGAPLSARTPVIKFRVIAIAEEGGIHKPFVDAAKLWLAKEA